MTGILTGGPLKRKPHRVTKTFKLVTCVRSQVIVFGTVGDRGDLLTNQALLASDPL